MTKPKNHALMSYLALLSGNDDVLVAVTTLFGRAIDPAAGVDHVAH